MREDSCKVLAVDSGGKIDGISEILMVDRGRKLETVCRFLVVGSEGFSRDVPNLGLLSII